MYVSRCLDLFCSLFTVGHAREYLQLDAVCLDSSVFYWPLQCSPTLHIIGALAMLYFLVYLIVPLQLPWIVIAFTQGMDITNYLLCDGL